MSTSATEGCNPLLLAPLIAGLSVGGAAASMLVPILISLIKKR
jgi:hypothetical protein